MDTLLAFIHVIENYIAGNPDWKQVLLIGMTPVFVIAFVIEYTVMQKRNDTKADFHLKDIISNLTLGGSYQIAELFYFAFFVDAAFSWVYSLRLFTLELSPLNLILLFFGLEFSYYWFHRASHRIRWFWCAHVVHHSSEHMNMTTAMRQSLTYTLNFSHLFWVPLILIGFSPKMVMIALALNLIYQYFIHTQCVDRLHPAIEFFFNTPSHHRAHHGRNPQYIDKNYGGVIIIFDRLFGTFVKEEAPVDFGIPRQIDSINLITLNFHEWKDMFKDALRPGPLSQRLKHLWAPPEWTRDKP
jgi:sterol desaturase/sphingolipid hydroxylase (fatty acid hydroxylase superfamily)